METWVSFSGESMVPGLRPGDRLLVQLIRPAELRQGDLVVTGPYRLEGRRVWSAHRCLIHQGRLATKGDAAADWDPPAAVVGKVLGLQRGRWRVLWGEGGQKLKHWVAWLSRRMQAGPRGRPWRVALRAVNILEWALQIGNGNVRIDSL